MRSCRVSFAPELIFRSDFAAEWVGVAALAIGTAAWALNIKFDLSVQWHDALLPCGVILAVMLAHVLMSRRASLVAEYFLLTAAATAVFGVASYLSMTTGRPLADGALMAADHAIGFDWPANYRWLLHHAMTAKVLEIAYDSLVYQGLYFGVLFGVMGKRRELREMFWLVAVSGLFTCAGAALFPALGPFKAFGVKAEFLPVMEQLRGETLHFALSNLTGVVSFPSFHTTMAVLYIYGFHRVGAIGWMIAGLNVVMMAAIPFFGGHYLVDMFAGGAVALASVAIVKAWPAIASPTVPSGEYVAIRLYDGLLEDVAARLSHQRDQTQ
jgi:hypothetical protein